MTMRLLFISILVTAVFAAVPLYLLDMDGGTMNPPATVGTGPAQDRDVPAKQPHPRGTITLSASAPKGDDVRPVAGAAVVLEKGRVIYEPPESPKPRRSATEQARLESLASTTPYGTAAEVDRVRESYYCDLAIQARDSCTRTLRTEDDHRRCLVINQYFAYSRLCGREP